LSASTGLSSKYPTALVSAKVYDLLLAVDQVTDFGLSIEKDGVGTDSMMDDYCGTPLYMCEYLS